MLEHVEFDNRIVENDYTLQQVRMFCRKGEVHRIYRRWEHLDRMSDLLRMLGFTIEKTSSSFGYDQYNVKSWFGHSQDIEAIRSLIYSISLE